jgi:hypothetical protein
MSTSTEIVQYMMNGAVQVMLPDGSQVYGVVELAFTPSPGSTVLTDSIVLTIQQAMVAAFPSAWGVTNGDLPINKTDTTTIAYATDYTSNPPAFA